MVSWVEMVEEFHRKRGERVSGPKVPSTEVVELRHNLMQEELNELVNSLYEGRHVDEVADGICDLLYVVIGTAVSCGLGPILSQLFTEVHRSNMSKFGPGEHRVTPGAKYEGQFGKHLLGYRPPRLGEIIDTYADALKQIDESILDKEK